MKENLNIQKILIYTIIGQVDKAEQMFTQNIKDKLLKENPLIAMEIIPQIEGYKKAKELIEKEHNIQKALEKINEILKNNFEKFKIMPTIEKDPEFNIEELWINIILPKEVSKEKIDKVEEEIINEIILKNNTDINYLFIKPRQDKR